jgi:hypothetical protein
MNMQPKHAVAKKPRRGIAARILLFVAGFALAGAGAALAFFVINVTDHTGNDAVAQASRLSAPTTPTAATEATATSATVSWTLPGSQLSGVQYQVTSSPGGKTCTSTGTSCTVSGLTAGTSYTFSIAAVLGNNWQSSTVGAALTTLGVTTTSPLSSGTVDGTYSAALVATGGTGTYKWAMTTGTLPSGLSLSTSGAITGTPKAAGTTSGLVFTVTDNGGSGASTSSGPLSITVNQDTSTTGLSLSSSSATYGSEGTETFSVTVTPNTPTSPTGTVAIMNGSTTLCTTDSLNASGHANCSFSSATQLGASATAYPITAAYAGDSNFNASTSSPAQGLTVSADSATVTAFSVTGSPTTYGSESGLTFSTTVTAGGSTSIPTGDTVNVTQGSTPLCTISLTSGSGTCSPLSSTVLPAGTYTNDITATFNSAGTDSNFASTATKTTSATIDKATAATAVRFTSSITYGHESSETFNATVVGVTGGTAPIGTVTIFDGSNPLCTTSGLNATGNQSAASCPLTAIQLAGGTYSSATGITATFNPVIDPNYQSSSSTAQTLTVTKDSTTATVSVSPASFAFGAENGATFTATVATGNSEALPGTETATINVGSTTCTASLTPSGSGGSGTCNINASALNASTTAYSATFTYGGDTNDLAASSQATAAGGFTVNKANQTITFTSTNPSPMTVGGSTYTPTGTGGGSGSAVAITLDGSSTGCTLTSGVVSFTAVGTCVIDANQAGNTNYNTATQVQQSITINKGSQTITITSTPTNPAVGGTYTVVATGGGSGNAVTITSATASVCTTSGSNGTAVTLVKTGTCTLDANQLGNSNYSAAIQVPQSFTVAAAPTITSLSPSTSTRGSNLTVTISGTGFVSGATVAFNPNTANDTFTVGTVTFNSANKLTVVISIPNSSRADGTYNVVVTNPDGSSSNNSTFTVGSGF